MEKKFCIVILNWNGLQDTIECIYSIVLSKSNDQFEIYLIDNDSDDDELNVLKRLFGKFENIKIIGNDDNLGFTKAHNKIFKRLIDNKFEYLLLLNNDTILPAKTADYLKNIFIEDNTGMVSFKMINFWDKNLLDNAGHKLLSSGEIIPIGHGEPISLHDYAINNIGSCAGATIYSKKMLDDIGYFDEYFDTGYEDAELGLRAYIAGYDLSYEPQLIVYHKMGQSISKVFNYQFALKAQQNIHYTYYKLVHWQVLLINFIPNAIRFVLITIVNILFVRFKYLKIQYQASYNVFIRDFRELSQARRKSRKLRRIKWWKLFLKQEFVLFYDMKRFYRLIVKGQKSYFEKF